MQVILLDRVNKKGHLGDQVKVKSGYARNYLIPKGKALPATKENIAKFEERRAQIEKLVAENLAAAQRRAEALSGLVVTVTAHAGDEGKLFGSVGASDLANAITNAGVPVQKGEIRLPEGPLRSLGEFEVTVHLHTEVNSTVKIIVAAEAA